LDISHWFGLLKDYGPTVGIFLGFIIWQSRKIDALLLKNSEIYEKEIQRLVFVQEKLLEQLLGQQPSSKDSPTVEQLKMAVNNKQKQLKKADQKGSR
jgi:hypothetical protein